MTVSAGMLPAVDRPGDGTARGTRRRPACAPAWLVLLAWTIPLYAGGPALAGKSPHLLDTPHLWLAPHRSAHLSVAWEGRAHWQAPLSGLEGTLQRYALLRGDFGVAPQVVLHLRGAVRQRLTIDSGRSRPVAYVPQSGTTADAGDFSVGTIMRLWQDNRRRNALGFRVETKLPNTTQRKGIGPNTTDVLLTVLYSRQWPRGVLFADLGVGILTAPRQLDEQNDVLIYGLGLAQRGRAHWQLAFEVNGYLTTRNLIPAGTEARGTLRAVLAWQPGKMGIEAEILRGVTRNEGTWGGGVALVRRLEW